MNSYRKLVGQKLTLSFTLLELLICVSLAFCLAALSAPALVSFKDRAKSVKCASNLRQIGIAINIYGIEKGTYPNTHIFNPVFGDNEWSYLISPFLGKTNASPSMGRNSRSPLLDCPASGKGKTANQLRCTYSMSMGGSSSNILRYPYMHRPSQVILVSDTSQDFSGSRNGESRSDYTMNSINVCTPYDSTTANQPVDPGNNLDVPGAVDPGQIRFRHGDNSLANALFFDGHVGAVKTNQVLQQSVLLGE